MQVVSRKAQLLPDLHRIVVEAAPGGANQPQPLAGSDAQAYTGALKPSVRGAAMQLNHLDLSVPDLGAATAFFETAFGFKLVNSFGTDMSILRGEGGFVLALTHCAEPQYPASFHIGFLQPSTEAVTAAHDHLLSLGIATEGPPGQKYGAFLFHCRAPGGILIEVSYRPG
jgi:catechol 2,3-dioxygenase-like lactoylglutathione lyase family enzyme